MKVKDYKDCYCVVQLRNWNAYKNDAFVEYSCKDLDEALRVQNSLERADGILFVVVSCYEGK